MSNFICEVCGKAIIDSEEGYITECEHYRVNMIKIKKSSTADTRTCDWSKVTKDTLKESSEQHRGDISKGMDFFKNMMDESAKRHDLDKLTNLDEFYADFITGFKQTKWWDNHRKINRHHFLQVEDIPFDVNLIDVLDMIIDCVMSGMGRSGSVYPLEITSELLKRAFDNTVELLKKNIEVQ